MIVEGKSAGMGIWAIVTSIAYNAGQITPLLTAISTTLAIAWFVTRFFLLFTGRLTKGE